MVLGIRTCIQHCQHMPKSEAFCSARAVNWEAAEHSETGRRMLQVWRLLCMPEGSTPYRLMIHVLQLSTCSAAGYSKACVATQRVDQKTPRRGGYER